MNKKILGIVLAFIFLAAMTTPMVLAKPWNPKNNEKFLDFDVVIGFDYGSAVFNVEQIPSEDKMNKLIVWWEEVATEAYTITVEGIGTYVCGTDFEYSGVAVYTTIGREFVFNPDTGFLVGDKEINFRVDYMYDFGSDDGNPDTIDGTLEMLAIMSTEEMIITTKRGTGDLQNVVTLATAAGLGHDGIVIGWPE